LPLACVSTDPPTPALYSLSLHDALPISPPPTAPTGRTPSARVRRRRGPRPGRTAGSVPSTVKGRVRARDRLLAFRRAPALARGRSEEHTSELQSRENLVCRLLLEKKKKK